MPKSETREDRIVRLITQLCASSTQPARLPRDTPPEDLALASELKRDGHIDGAILTAPGGQVVRAENLHVLASGHALLKQLVEQREKNTSIGIIKRNRWGFYKWFFTVLGGAVILYLFKLAIEKYR